MTITVSIPQPSITALVFEGGGIKGLVYAGALEALDEKNLLKDVKWVAGSSAGAMTALMVALGYTNAEIEQELKAVNFAQFKDHGPSWLGVVGRTINGLRNLLGLKRGYYRGEKLYAWVKTIVEKKLGSTTATFNDLHKKAIANPTFKELFVTATNVQQQATEFFSYEERGNAPIADAVLASMSIPLFFQARYLDSNYRIDWEPTREKIKSGVLVPYVDGGYLNNDPIGIFQDRKYWPSGYFELIAGKPINPGALNLRVDSKGEINALWGKPNNPIIRTFAWLKNLLINVPSADNNKLNDYGMVTIEIPDCNIPTKKFSLTEDEKAVLKRAGKKTTLSYIDLKRENAVYTIMKYETIIDLEADYQTKQKTRLDLLKLRAPEQNDKEHLDVLTLECAAMEKTLLAQNVRIPEVKASDSVKHCCSNRDFHKLNVSILERLRTLVVRGKTDEKQIQLRKKGFIACPVHSKDCDQQSPYEIYSVQNRKAPSINFNGKNGALISASGNNTLDHVARRH